MIFPHPAQLLLSSRFVQRRHCFPTGLLMLIRAYPQFPHLIQIAAVLPDNGGVFLRWYANAVLPLPGYSFSDGYSFFKVQLIDELP